MFLLKNTLGFSFVFDNFMLKMAEFFMGSQIC